MLSRTKGQRIAIINEPDTTSRINPGIMRQLIGGDTFYARSLINNPFITYGVRPSYGKQSNGGA